jgi:hypothetical protein
MKGNRRRRSVASTFSKVAMGSFSNFKIMREIQVDVCIPMMRYSTRGVSKLIAVS